MMHALARMDKVLKTNNKPIGGYPKVQCASRSDRPGPRNIINVHFFTETRISCMAKRGRSSAGELSVIVDISRAPPPPPPPELPVSQQTIWRDIMGSIPSGHISRAAFPVLTELCRHIEQGRMLAGLVGSFKPEWASTDEGLQRLDRLLAMHDRSTKTIVACARSLRLTPQSMVHPTTAARRMANQLDLGGQKPWDPD